MQTLAITVTIGGLLATGFAAGFITREMISRRRRWLIEKREEGWK